MFMGTSITLAYYSSQKMLSNANVDDELLRLQQEQMERINDPGEDAPSDVQEPVQETD
jgi:hypothetical protein